MIRLSVVCVIHTHIPTHAHTPLSTHTYMYQYKCSALVHESVNRRSCPHSEEGDTVVFWSCSSKYDDVES